MGTVAENLTIISDSLKDIKRAIISKGVTPSGDITTYGNAIRDISGGDNIKYLPCIRRNGAGYIDTGVAGANSNLRIEISYSLNTIPKGYFNLFYAYVDENTNATRAIMNGKNYTYCSLNSLASASLTLSVTRVTGRVYTESLGRYSSSAFAYYSTAGAANKAFSSGNSLSKDNTICLLAKGTDDVDINLHSFRIYDSDNLVKDFAPCVINGVYGMMDILSGIFYRSSGYGEFMSSGQNIPMNIE